METDGPAALRRMIEMFLSGATDLDVLEFDGEKLASDWQAERAQAAADRAALAQARAETANLRDALQDLYDDWQGPSTSSLVAARAALRLGGAR